MRFIGLIAYPMIAAFYFWRQLRNRMHVKTAVVATVCTAVPYAHYAFSRGDVGMVRQYTPNGRAFVATPYWPGAYAMQQRRSPLWEIYATSGRSDYFQKEEVVRLRAANPGFAIVLDLPLDSREELRYRHAHLLTLVYIEAHSEQLPLSNPFTLFSRKKTNALFRHNRPTAENKT
ncbi:hypothetical protein [Xanthomonas vesicatoria]|uniref:DUF1254 domain-containing protein n=1 Tax=Xanthomonas vesicatoria TaxID=56460 RepID=A0ABS8LEJ5_9XANT|nr:hypothetical protein [Xanthomonas vesicatoria]MCC8619346.1 hypothetical protein [Xanthomonas vesicatoria]MCC8624182.1 hypothetical protein [Xanthomonas vesicatoria]MCC8631788.1 hypothetical protein [Xanthomonas vesicatoria]MCC8696098.1 hypothetical protein [Xanthomonas vesicatoria]MCC8704244.1 hypothetical protein [Xanthomonas vesicatoria]